MVTVAAHALVASSDAAALTAAPKGVAVGFEALLAGLFARPTHAGGQGPAHAQALDAPAASDDAASGMETALAALQAAAAALPTGQAALETTAPQGDENAPARPNAADWGAGEGKPTPGQLNAATHAAETSVPGQS